MRHPREMGASEVEVFLTHLATDRKVSASTHNQALSAILFLYREVLAIELPWLNGINRPTQKRRIPSVLTKDEVAGLLAQMDGETALIARLLYGTGMRLMEGSGWAIRSDERDRPCRRRCPRPPASEPCRHQGAGCRARQRPVTAPRQPVDGPRVLEDGRRCSQTPCNRARSARRRRGRAHPAEQASCGRTR